jgi:hypothetical protein
VDKPTAIDGSDGPLTTRRIVVWRRLEPGDVRTPGTEIAPESPHIEAKIIEVGIATELHEDLARLWKKRDEVTSIATTWTARYEPAGVLFAIGGSGVIATLLDMLPFMMLPLSVSFVVLGATVGVWTRARKRTREREAARRWRATEEREELEKIEKRLVPRWERFAAKLREEEGFRADVRVGDIHEADRLVSIDPALLTHPDTWKPDAEPNEVRYGWMYRDGRVLEQKAELEDNTKADAEPDPTAPARESDPTAETLGSPSARESDATAEALRSPTARESDATAETLGSPSARESDATAEALGSPTTGESDATAEALDAGAGPRPARVSGTEPEPSRPRKRHARR